MLKHFFFIFSLIFIFTSCNKDDGTGPSPPSIVGTWSSGELSYHQTDDCLNQGQSIEDFVEVTIAANVEIQAQIVAEALCLDELDYETCLAEQLEQWINTLEDSQTITDSLLFTDLISSAFSYNNMTLVINSGSSYEAQYDGSCIDFDAFSQGACELFSDVAEWSNTSEECIFLTENACTEIGSGTWDDGWVGDWEEDGDNYTLHNFNDEEGATKTLVFDGSSLFIVLSTSEDQCLCGTSAPSDSSVECAPVDDCIWIESHCISLNFSN